MKSIKEKQLLVKWARAMNEPVDPALAEEVDRYNQLQQEIKESIRSNTINDLFDASKVAVEIINKVTIEYPKPPTLEELLSIVQEESNELVQAQAAETPTTIEEASPPDTPRTEAVAEEVVEEPSDLISRAAKHIHKEVKSEEASFQQPQPTPVEKNFNDVQKKLKFLEQAIGKIAATGPGSGEVELKRLDDVDYASVSNATNNQVLSYNADSKLWIARSAASGGGGIALTDLSVTVDVPSGNGNLTYNDTTGVFNFSPANVIAQVQSDWNVSDTGNVSYIKNKPVIPAYTSNLVNDNNFITASSLTTANVAELTNLYFTNARARQSITVSGAGTYDNATGIITINTSSSSYGDANIYSNVTLLGYITNNALTGYATNSQLGSYATNAQLASYATNSQLATYATNAQLTGYATNSQLAVYATNAQLTSYATTTNVALKANIVDLTTTNVTELTNLYFTNARVYTNVTQLGYITSSALSGYATNSQLATYATNSQLATYATNAQLSTYATNAQLAVYATNTQLTSYATTTNVALKANIVDLTTANVTELTNLYFTNARATSAVTNTALSNITISGNTVINGNVTTSKIITSSIIGSPTNTALYNLSAANTFGGTGYADVIKLTNTSGGIANLNKFIRLNTTGSIEIINSAYLVNILTLDDVGNLSIGGYVSPGKWTAGQVIKDTMLSNSEVTVSTTTVATSTNDTDFMSYSYTPVSSSSYLVIHVHVSSYDALSASGTGSDSYFSRIKVGGNEITYSRQATRDNYGFRTGPLFPLTGRYTNSDTSAKTITVAVRRDTADDNISIVNTSTALWMRITEIAR